MDGGGSAVLLKGDSGLLTASGLFKPAYYAHLILSKFQGELIAYDPHYVAIRTTGDRPCYLIAVLNYNASTSRICTGAAALGEVQDAIERYRDEAGAEHQPVRSERDIFHQKTLPSIILILYLISWSASDSRKSMILPWILTLIIIQHQRLMSLQKK